MGFYLLGNLCTFTFVLILGKFRKEANLHVLEILLLGTLFALFSWFGFALACLLFQK